MVPESAQKVAPEYPFEADESLNRPVCIKNLVRFECLTESHNDRDVAEEGGIVRGGNLLICLGICRLRMIETTAFAGDPIRDNLMPPSTWRAT